MTRSIADHDTVTLAAGTYYGEGRVARRTGGVRLTESVHAAGATPRHVHEEAYFCYVLAGAFDERRPGRSYAVRPGALVFHPADVWHDDRFAAAETRCLNVEIPEASPAGCALFAAGTPSDGPVPGHARTFAAELAREVRAWDSASPLVAEGLALSLAATMSRTARPVTSTSPRRRGRSRWAARAAELLRESIDAPPSLHELAIEVGVSVATVHRGFATEYGCTVGTFIRRARIERARGELISGRTPLAQIAFACGFADQAHFTRVFREATGWTPAAFRRAHAR